MRQTHSFVVSLCCFVLGCLALSAAGAGGGSGTAEAGDSKTAQALKALPPKPLSQRVPVTIYEFRSSVQEVDAAALTDVFTTALIKSGQFRVVERARLNQGVVMEKQLNGAGHTTGDTAQHQLRGARYIFEGTVSQANPSEDTGQGDINIGGLSLGHGSNRDVVGIDVRIVDADTGDVLDAVDVSHELKNSSASVSGTAALISSVASLSGHSADPLTPDVNYQGSHKESLNAALRACIEDAVLQLAQRVELSADTAADK